MSSTKKENHAPNWSYLGWSSHEKYRYRCYLYSRASSADGGDDSDLALLCCDDWLLPAQRSQLPQCFFRSVRGRSSRSRHRGWRCRCYSHHRRSASRTPHVERLRIRWHRKLAAFDSGRKQDICANGKNHERQDGRACQTSWDKSKASEGQHSNPYIPGRTANQGLRSLQDEGFAIIRPLNVNFCLKTPSMRRTTASFSTRSAKRRSRSVSTDGTNHASA